MATKVTIRLATVDDQPAVTTFGARTFSETFAAANTPSDMAAYLNQAFNADVQRNELTDPSCRTLLAEIGDALAGYAQLKLGPAPECVTGAAPIELVRFYVDREWRGLGIARDLMEATLDAASAAQAQTVWLGVWEHNPRAIRFYEKHGFVDVGSHEFVLGQDRQTDRIMQLALTPPAII